MAQLIKSNGSVSEVKPKRGNFFTLKELQGYVGGYIQVITLAGRDKLMVLNEDGLEKKLPKNAKATELGLKAGIIPGTFVVGDVLVILPTEMR